MEKNNMEKIGDIIREHRKAQGLTQEELGKKLFVTKQTISKWETGRVLPDIEMIRRLSEILNIRSDEILGGTVQEIRRDRRRIRVLIALCSAAVLLVCLLLGMNFFEQKLIESGYQDGINGANQYAERVTMTQLLAVPERYHGKLVRVIGVGNLEFEGNYIALSKEHYKYDVDSWIWLELGEKAIPYKQAQQYNGKYVIVEGIFDMNDRGHFDLFHGTIKEISRYQLWETTE